MPGAAPPVPTTGKRPLILHVTGDFPDPYDLAKTKVVRTLVDMASSWSDHAVLSINRVSPRLREYFRSGPLNVSTREFEYGTAVEYGAPPRGLLHATSLARLGDWMTDHIRAMPRMPDAIVGHKLTIEGIAVRRAANALGLPYALSIQGDTDTKILAARPDLVGELRAVLHGAAMVFPFTPWAWDRILGKLGAPDAPHILLPCPTDIDHPLAPVEGDGSVLSVFHLKSFKRKNLSGMARAMQLLSADGTPPALSVIGGGTPREIATCERIVQGIDAIRLEGPLDREAVRARMNTASAFILPSLRESFGLVFIEALFSGVPIIYPKGTSVDGYFDDTPFAIAVDARDPKAIADAIRLAVRQERELKQALAQWQKSPAAVRFQRERIARDFIRGLAITVQSGRG